MLLVTVNIENRIQAIAIGFSEVLKEGAKVKPAPKNIVQNKPKN